MMKDSNPHFAVENPVGTRKDFSKNYRESGHALSKRFTSSGLGPPGRELNTCSAPTQGRTHTHTCNLFLRTQIQECVDS
jgi:hypothetical protein